MKLKTCRFIEHGIYFKQLAEDSLTVKHCCNMDALPENEQPHLIETYKGGEIDWEKLFEEKRKDREKFARGEYYDSCKNCWELQEIEADKEDYISHVTLAHITKCNSRCVYCGIGKDETLHNSPQKYRLLPLLKEMKEKNLLRFTGSLRYMGGEPTLLHDFEEITDMFVENNIPEIYLPTSGIKLSKAMLRACAKVPICNIFISVDSGCEETYKKIKGLNAYKAVMNSLKQYADANIMREHVISKFIAVLDINDNTEELDKWIAESKKAGVVMLAFDIEYSYANNVENEKYMKHLINLKNYADKQITLAGLNRDPYLPYIQKLQCFEQENKEKLENDTSSEIINIDISRQTKQQIEEQLLNIIKEKSIWNKPIINLTTEKFNKKILFFNVKYEKEITEEKQFDEILSLCRKLGFKTKLKTNANNFNKSIKESLKLSDIELLVNRKGNFAKQYFELDNKKVRFF